ncbi:MAG: Rieske (2Fe-2S) protein [Candidatus Nitrosopolaris sp.]
MRKDLWRTDNKTLYPRIASSIIVINAMAAISKDHDIHYVFATNLANIREASGGCLSIQIRRHTVVLFYHNSKVYAVDNRCPHMGFPLSQGTVKDSILTCHWHHARFDLNSGGTFDQWAGDVRSFPVEIRNEDEVWVDVSSMPSRGVNCYEMLLQNGLKQNIQLIIAKAVIAIFEENQIGNHSDDSGLAKEFCMGLDFGTHYKQSGWGQGLTILTCMMNIMPYIDRADKPHALYHGLCAVAQDCADMPPRFDVSPLPEPWPDLATLKRWFRQFIESRDTQAAERCIVTALRLGANIQQMADMLFAAATDHRFLDIGHILDFTNKALEAVDELEWENNKSLVESVLTSLIRGYATAERMEESGSWRHPIDLVTILENGFKELPVALDNGKRVRVLTHQQQKTKDNNNHKDKKPKQTWSVVSPDRDALVAVLLGDDPQSIANALLEELRQGTTEEELASIVCYASALRIAQFHTRNEFSDWDAALHTFTFSNAVHQGLRRLPTMELLRGVFDAAMRIYLNRFLNIPPVTIPKKSIYDKAIDPDTILRELTELLDKQQRVNEAGQLVADYLYQGGRLDQLTSMLGKLLLREDRNFHSIQMIEGAYKQYFLVDNEGNNAARVNILLAASRYLRLGHYLCLHF